MSCRLPSFDVFYLPKVTCPLASQALDVPATHQKGSLLSSVFISYLAQRKALGTTCASTASLELNTDCPLSLTNPLILPLSSLLNVLRSSNRSC